MRVVRTSRLSTFTALVCAFLLIAPHVALAAVPLRAPTGLGPRAVDPQGPPSFDVDYSQDNAWGTGWTPSVYASVYVGSLTDPAWAASAPTDAFGNFNINIAYDVAPGDVVWVSEGENLRSLSIASLTVTEVNAVTDTVSGTAAPGAQDVSVGFDGDPYYAEPVVVQSDGTWTADFSGQRDLVPGSQGNVRQGDGDGDATHIRWRARNAVFRVSPEGDSLWGHDWLPGGQVTITIGDPQTPVHTAYATADGTGNFNTAGIGYDIQVGDTVTVSDAEITKDTLVTDLAVTSLDVDADTVSGTAQPNAPVFVNLNVPDGRSRSITADAGGNWFADFSVAVGEGPQDQTWDLKPGDNGGVDEYDIDGDGTNVGFRINNPWFRVSRWDDNVWGGEWQPNTGITITVGDPGSPEHTFSTSTDDWGNFSAGGIGYDLEADSFVTVDDGQSVKDHLVTALTVDFVDAETETIMGLANPGAPVNVWVNAPGGGIQRHVTADDYGFWIADFSSAVGAEPWEQEWDIAPGANGSAEEYDDDNDGTQVPWQLANPSFAVDPEHDSLWGWQWEPGTEVGIEIGTELIPDYSDAVWCDEWGNWNLDITGYDVRPGETVTVLGEGAFKEHLVRNVTVTDVDPEADQVHGTASPDASVWVDLYYVGIQREVTADAEGSWTADFSVAVGEEPWQQAADIAPGTEGVARETDEDGDNTQASWRVRNTNFTVDPATDDLWGNDWLPGTTLSITVGASAPYLYEGTADVTEWGDFNLQVEHDLVAGDLVTVSDGSTTKTHQITQLTLTDVDTELDTVSGTAAPGTVVLIDVNADWGEWSGREAIADSLGNWTADFSVAGAEEWQGVFDIGPGTQVNANQSDEDGDYTYAGRRVPNPTFTANPQDDEFWGSEWEPFSQVFVTVGTEEPLDFGEWADVDEWGNFGLWGIEYDLKPGDFVTVSDGIMTKTHTVLPITVSDVDLELDLVSGTAEPGSIFWVDVNDDGGGWSGREVEADELGSWTADFSVPGPGEGQEPFDLRPGVSVGASLPDDDGDATWAGLRIPNPCFAVNADDDQVWGWEWNAGAQLTLTFGNPASPDYEATVEVSEWGDFGTDRLPYDVQVGQLVTVTGGTGTKQHVVRAVAVTGVDAALDTVSGTATPGSELWVSAGNNWGDSGRNVTADENGAWTADFSVQGPEDWQQPFDIGPGTWVNANVSDEDGDQTNAGRYLANPVFRANPRDNEVFGHEWPGGAQLEVAVGDPADPDFEGTAAADEWGDFYLGLEGYDLVIGDLVMVTDGSTVKQHYVTDLVIEGVDAELDTVYGTAEPGSWLDVFPHGAEDVSRWLQADESTGEWVAYFAGEYDVRAGSNGAAMQYDEDEDATWVYWSVPQPQFRADPVHDDIWGWEFLDGPTVTVIVGSLAAPDFIKTVDSGAMGFRVDTEPYDLKPGDVVTVSDGVSTKVHTVTGLTVAEVDADADTVSGTAAPGTWVWVNPYEDWNRMPYSDIADESTGAWTVSFFGDYDIVVGTSGGAAEFDDDEDATEVVWTAIANTPPVLDTIGEKSVDEGSLLTFTVTATDADGDPLFYELVGDLHPGASIDPVTGVFTWTPTEAQGPHTYMVSISVSDGEGGQDGASIPVTVNEVNVAPLLATIGSKSIGVGQTLAFTATATDSDIPANTLTFSLDPGAPAGASITGGGAFSWTPSAAGSFPVTVRVSDGTASDFETVTITVSDEPPPNTPPVLAAIGPQSVNELATLSFTASATDANGDTLTYSLTGAPSGAVITAGGAFTWTPAEAQGPGSYDITVVVSDGTLTDAETITVTVAERNQEPWFNTPIDNKTVDETTLLTFTVTATDADLPANTLTFTLVGDIPDGAAINPTTGVFSWTPTEAQGPQAYTVSLRVDDGQGASDLSPITVTVNEVDAAPVLAPIGAKSATVGVPVTFTAAATDSDIPANTLTFSLVGAPAGASINASSGLFSWTPSTAGSFPLTVRVFDGTVYDTEDITITVAATNNPPVLAPIGPKSVNELATLAFTASATDSDGDTLTYSATGLPTGATFTPATRTFTWTPTEAQGPSTPTVRITVSDGKGGTDFEDVVITVAEVNVPPVIVPIGNKAATVGVPLSFTVAATDADLPANAFTFSFTSAPSGAAITAGGLFTFTPTAVGSYPVTVSVSDGKGGSDTDAFTITATAAPEQLIVTPIEGANRYATAIAASKKAFPAGADFVVVATGMNWPDALGGSALAGALDAPILLTRQDVLPAEVRAEIVRLKGARASIHAIVLGGTPAVSAAVYNAIDAIPGVSVERIAGANRYETANRVAARTIAELGGEYVGHAFVATGMNFPDALAASPIAAAAGVPIYLANPAWGNNAALAATMKAAGVKEALILGGTNVVSSQVQAALNAALMYDCWRYFGANRYETAVKVATEGTDWAGLSWDKVAIATGENFPDALAGGVLQGKSGSVMLLTPSRSLNANVAAVLSANKATIFEVRFLGSTAAVSAAVRTSVTNILK